MASLIKPKSRKIDRTAAFIDVGETVSGIFLGIFIISHLALVSTILLGELVFNKVAGFLETSYLIHVAVFGVAILILIHAVLVVSKIPTRIKEHIQIFKRTQSMKHFDTLVWLVQVGSGLLIFAFGFAHMWGIYTNLPIEAAKSAEEARSGSMWFYTPFLLLIAAHLSAGFYRICVKWNIMPRKLASWLMKVIFIAYIAIAVLNMTVFYRLGGGG